MRSTQSPPPGYRNNRGVSNIARIDASLELLMLRRCQPGFFHGKDTMTLAPMIEEDSDAVLLTDTVSSIRLRSLIWRRAKQYFPQALEFVEKTNGDRAYGVSHAEFYTGDGCRHVQIESSNWHTARAMLKNYAWRPCFSIAFVPDGCGHLTKQPREEEAGKKGWNWRMIWSRKKKQVK